MYKETLQYFSDSLVSETLKEELPVVAASSAGVIVDTVQSNPVSAVTNLASILLSTRNIANMFLLKKLLRFLSGISDMTLDKRVRFSSKYIDGNENEFAEKLLIIIEKLDDLSKANILANLFRSLSDETIDINMFMRLSNALANTLIEDLLFLEKNDDKTRLEYNCHSDTLLNNGYYRRSRALFPGSGDSKDFACEVTALGKKMVQCGLRYHNGYIAFEEMQVDQK